MRPWILPLLLGLFATPALAQPADPAAADEALMFLDGAPEAEPHTVDVHVEVLNLFLLRNDSDFDMSEPIYSPGGQSVGVLGTFMKPDLTWHVRKNLRLFYEAEVGLNLWSLHNPDQQDATASDVFLLKHREVYAEGEFLDGWLGFKVGYQRVQDPTRLFVDHWIGAATLSSDMRLAQVTAMVGQIADPTYEGFRVEENNFSHDTFVYGLTAQRTFLDFVRLSLGLWGLDDGRVVGRRNRILSPVINLDADIDVLRLGLDGAMQFGAFEGAAVDGGDQSHLAWAVQLYGVAQLARLGLKLNLMALSADDADGANGANGAFHYSAKSRSSTLLFTESELRDTFDNFDEKLGVSQGGFTLVRPGMLLADLMVSYDVWRGIRPTLIVGYARALNPDNALGEAELGWEFDAGVEIELDDALLFQLYGSVLLPGEGLAARVNAIDLQATEPLLSCMSALKVTY